MIIGCGFFYFTITNFVQILIHGRILIHRSVCFSNDSRFNKCLVMARKSTSHLLDIFLKRIVRMNCSMLIRSIYIVTIVSILLSIMDL